MDRSRSERPARNRPEDLADAQDLRSVITAALRATPVDELALRRGVWTYVSAERRTGTSPGQVILSLTLLIEGEALGPPSVRQALMRRAILWCVESYFGHLGEDDPRSSFQSAMTPPT